MKRKTDSKPNGIAGAHGPNGHSPASMMRGGVSGHGDLAASLDASGTSVACVALVATGGAARDACEEAAPPRKDGDAPKPRRRASLTEPKNAELDSPVGPGEQPLPDDPRDFVEEVHRNVDLVELWVRLLRSTDDKVRQRATEKLTEMRYKGAAALSDEPQPIVIDIDSAVARRAAEGAAT